MITSVSIIIPVYNVELYIEECLLSVIGQSYDHSLLECIIVNDCTPDNSMEIVDKVIKDYKGEITFKIISHENNQGLSVARNSGMKHVTGDYLFFLDSDDYLLPDCILLLVEALKDNPHAELSIGNFYYEMNGKYFYELTANKVIHNINYLYFGIFKKVSVWNMLIKNELIDNSIVFDDGILFEDTTFDLKLFPKVSCAVIIPQATYFYRDNNSGIIKRTQYKKIDKTINSYFHILNSYIEHLDKRCFVGQCTAAFTLGVLFVDFLRNNEKNIIDIQKVRSSLDVICKKYIIKNLKNFRIVLCTLFILWLNPFNKIFNFRLCRRHYDNVIALFWHLALWCDIFHKRNKNMDISR